MTSSGKGDARDLAMKLAAVVLFIPGAIVFSLILWFSNRWSDNQ